MKVCFVIGLECTILQKKKLNYGSKLPIKKVTQNNGNSKIKKKSLIK